jgi:hypothetical protein
MKRDDPPEQSNVRGEKAERRRKQMHKGDSPPNSEIDRQNTADQNRYQEIHIWQLPGFKVAEKECITGDLPGGVGSDYTEKIKGKEGSPLQITWPQVEETLQFRGHWHSPSIRD